MLGAPVTHSLSPVLHGAAYAALGLDDWTYERVECDAAALPGFVAACDASWAGLSVTMPGKRAALAVATRATPRARRLATANTLVRRAGTEGAGEWSADCTDVDGVAGALRAAGMAPPARGGSPVEAVVLGNGATAAAALDGLHDLGCAAATVVARAHDRAAGALAVARADGLAARSVTWGEIVPGDLARASALVSTTPAGAVDAERAAMLVAALPASAVVLDAVYHPWPTPLAAAALERGLAVATGLDMLLHQAFGQVEQFTGRSAPRAAMHAALVDATGFGVRPPG